MSHAPSSDKRYWLAAVAIVGVGVALRVQQFALARSLWIDEAMLAFGALPASDSSFIGQLPYGQVAPPGFLLVARAMLAVAGPSELSLRAPALLAGCAALVSAVILARRVSGDVGALVVSLVLSFSPAAVYYSQEFKPYAFDMLFAALVPLLTLRAWSAGGDARRWTVLVTVCAIGPLFSTGAVLVSLGVLVPLTLLGLGRRDRNQLLWQGVAASAAVLAFGLCFWSSYRFATNNDVMMTFWKGAYLDIGSADGLGRSAELLRRLVWGVLIGPPPRFVWWVTTQEAVGLAFNGMAAVAFAGTALGAWRLVRDRHSAVMLCLVGPLMALALASLAHRYPLAARLALFASVPAAVLASAAVAGTSGRATSPTLRAGGIVSAGMLVVLAFPADGRWRLSDAQWSAAADLVYKATAAGIPIYVNARGTPQLLHYGARQAWPSSAVAHLYHMSQYGGIAFENSPECPVEPPILAIGPRSVTTLVVGSPTGMRFEYMPGWNQREPCPEWAASEARRIAAAGSDIMLLFLHHIDKTASFLLSQLAGSGWVCEEVTRNYDELLIRCRRGATSSRRDETP